MAILAGGVLLTGCGGRPGGESPPNLVLITVDTLRPEFLGVYGETAPASPNLDRLAEKALVFDRAIATAPFTGPSHASILTSQHPSTHGVVLNGHRSPDAEIGVDARTLAEHLTAAGYATRGIVSCGPLDRRFGFGRGFEAYTLVLRGDNRDSNGPGDKVTAFAVDWLRTREMKQEDSPFFLWLHYFDPHLPYVSGPEHRAALGLDDDTAVTVDNVLDLPGEFVRGAYRAEVREADFHIGAFLDFLAERGLADATVVAVVSDHGEYLQEHGLYDHHGLRDEVLHVPMFVRAPGMTAQERRAEVVSTIDLAPTLLDLLDLPALPGAQGRSLLGTGPGDARPVFAEWRDFRLLLKRHEAGPGDFQIGVQDGDAKLIRDLLAPEASLLFDLAADPAEDLDLFPERAALRARLQDVLDRHVRETLPAGLAGLRDIEIDAESMEMLRSLGYIR